MFCLQGQTFNTTLCPLYYKLHHLPGYPVYYNSRGAPFINADDKRWSFLKKAGNDLAKAKANANAITFARQAWHTRFAPDAEDLLWFMQGCPADVDGKPQLLPPYGPPSAETIEQAHQEAKEWASALGRPVQLSCCSVPAVGR